MSTSVLQQERQPDRFASVDSWALITGGGGEIGRETALRLAKAGSNIVIADCAAQDAEETAHQIENVGRKARVLLVDVGDHDTVTSKVSLLSKELGGFSSLINIAGIFGEGPVEELSADLIAKVFRVNVFGLFYICKAVLPGMMERRTGAIVNTASVHALRGEPNASAYASSKGAVISFTKALAREKGAFGIRANVVAPGPINTAHWRGGDEGERLAQRIEKRIQLIPLRRVGIPADIAGVITFLVSPDSAFITGQVVSAGGGELMQ